MGTWHFTGSGEVWGGALVATSEGGWAEGCVAIGGGAVPAKGRDAGSDATSGTNACRILVSPSNKFTSHTSPSFSTNSAVSTPFSVMRRNRSLDMLSDHFCPLELCSLHLTHCGSSNMNLRSISFSLLAETPSLLP